MRDLLKVGNRAGEQGHKSLMVCFLVDMFSSSKVEYASMGL